MPQAAIPARARSPASKPASSTCRRGRGGAARGRASPAPRARRGRAPSPPRGRRRGGWGRGGRRSRFPVGAGAVALLPLVLGLIRFDSAVFVAALAAVLGGF